jgi:uncharacterized protein (DUF2252 family)
VEGTREERKAAGLLLRKRVPRSTHAEWSPGPNRRDPIDVLEHQNSSRVPDLVPVRYGRMADSPFAFFRGAAAVMAMDLASTPATGLRVQACGDAHVSNFGEFATPERNLVFDVNDFDETLPAPWEWDVKRLCASLHIVGRQRAFTPAQCDELVLTAARTYRECVAEYVDKRVLELWYDRIAINDVIAHFPRRYRPLVKRDVKKARRKDHLRAAAKLTKPSHGVQRFVHDPPIIVRLEHTEHDMDEVASMIDSYRASLTDDRRDLFDRFRFVDVARKAVGVGSVGTRCWVCLFEGPDHPEGDPLVLQAKEASASVLERYAGASVLGHHGLRVVTGQRVTQAASDMFLGWCEGPKSGRQYYVRQLWDHKGQGDPMVMEFNNLTHYGALCAWALARAHARTGDPVQLASYLGTSDTFDRAMAQFSAAYATTNEADYQALLGAILDQRVAALVGV